jgi:hypothetical protein
MKTLIITLAGLATAGAAFASVDPTLPMVTGRGNVSAKPAQLIVTNQTNPSTPAPAAADATVDLAKFTVTGSLLPHAAATTPKK